MALDMDIDSYNILVSISNYKAITVEELINQIIKDYIVNI